MMATGTSRRERREITRPHGSAPRSTRVKTAIPGIALTAGHHRWLVVVAVLVGLFAMHGPGTHGAHAGEASAVMHPESVSSAPGMSTPGMSSTGHDNAGALAGGPLTADVDTIARGSADDESSDPASGAVGLLGLCLALLAFGMLWLRRWTAGRPQWTVPRRALTARVAQLSVTACDLSPPLRAELSIWRC